MNHKWTELSGKPVKGEIDRKVCENCRLEWRRIRRGSIKPHGGWIETQYRRGRGSWQTHHGNKMIPCNHCRECPTCNGTGLVTSEKYLEMKHGESGETRDRAPG